MKRVVAVAALAAVAAAAVAFAEARSIRLEAAPLPGLPKHTAGYATWTKLNRKPIPPRSSDPHEGTKNVYTNKAAGKGRYPAGTVIVKEAVRPGTKFVGLIAVMRKLPGSNPRHNDWQMIEYVRGTKSARFQELARGDVCYACHVGARKNDYVFTRRSKG
jgi:hypothetical protein